MIKLLINGNPSSVKYSPAIRKFCFRIQFYSSGAYKELRSFFNNHLPTIRTMRKWLRCIDTSPGITQAALDIISDKANEYKEKGEQLHICLISDEMSLRKQVLWNEQTRNFDGFSETINSTNDKRQNNKLPVAKDALVFMAVGPNFRITVANFLLCGLDAVDRAALTKEVIRKVDATGAKVISLTGDGLYANLKVAKLLGIDFGIKRPYFPRPDKPNEKIYIIFDPPHMFKLLRAYFALHKLRHENDDLKWSLLEEIANKQSSDNFSLGNKLSKRHMRWKDAPMNVRLAVETFSNSVADALEQLGEDGYDGFTECKKEVQFIRLCNNVFDVMNFGENKKIDNYFKQPLCANTKNKFFLLFEEFELFTSKLSMEVKRNKCIKRLPAQNQMGFFGLLINMQSTFGIYEDYVQSGPLTVFYPFQYSQDNLETYFSLVRGSLGANNNPNVQQFQSAYRKLLFCTPHISGDTNCNTEFPSDLLDASSRCQHSSSSLDQNTVVRAEEFEIAIDYDTLISDDLEPYERHLCALSASGVEAKIIRSLKSKSVSECQDCLNVFRENEKITDTFIAKKQERGQLIEQPCSSTVNVILASEKIMQILKSSEHIEFASMIKTIFNNLDIDSLYTSSLFSLHCHEKVTNVYSHKEDFIFKILETYMHMKSKKICERISEEERGETIKRKKLRRAIILAGQ